MHYMKWARVMLPLLFEKFEPVCISFAIFFFSLKLSTGKRLTLAKIQWGTWRGMGCSPFGFYRPGFRVSQTNQNFRINQQVGCLLLHCYLFAYHDYILRKFETLRKKCPYSGPHFPTFGLNTGRYSLSFRIQSKCGEMRTRITPNTDTFHAVKGKCQRIHWRIKGSGPSQGYRHVQNILRIYQVSLRILI